MTTATTSAEPLWKSAAFRAAAIGGALFGAGAVCESALGLPRVVWLPLYLGAIVLAGYHWIAHGVRKLLRDRVVGIDLLMAAAAAGAAALDLWNESAAIVFLFGLAESIEEWTYERAQRSVEGLLDLAPRFASVVRDGDEVQIPVDQLRRGDVFRIRAGASIATDGVVESGTSGVDESALTGESIPVAKEPGSQVFAGTTNGTGVLTVRATAASGESTLQQLVKLVELARRDRGRSQLLVERFTKIYTPFVLALALAFLAIPLFSGAAWSTWGRLAVVLLVAAAPCALAMSTPVAFAAGISIAGKHGILIKGGRHLEMLGRIRSIAFDKTGTLTRGRPEVVRFEVLGSRDERETVAMVAAVEQLSSHPLASAFVRFAATKGVVEIPSASDHSSVLGAGVSAKVGNVAVQVTEPDAFPGKWPVGAKESLVGWADEGITPAVVIADDVVLALLGFRDEPRAEARTSIATLKQMGFARLVVLSGDRMQVARHVSREVGITEGRGGLSPEGKVRAIRDLASTNGPVAMVGDGINDAPALAASDLGIAMGALGSNAALESADVALMADTIEHLDEAFRIGRSVQRVVRQNVVFSIVVLGALIPSALFGILSITQVVIIHEAAELLAVLNGLRPLRAARLHARDRPL
ncbi:MAG: cation-translocating P-type ATPase [Planctomycetes bacterium]|nr:cation-translocating P-type ATPase [Planctomycetota bacterium]